MDTFKSYNKLTMGFNTSSLRQMSREASKPPQVPFPDQSWVWHTKQASCLWQWQLLPLSSPTSDRGRWGARKSTGHPTVANGEWGRLPWVSPCSQAVCHWLLNPQSPLQLHLCSSQSEGHGSLKQFQGWSRATHWNLFHFSNYPNISSFLPSLDLLGTYF